MSIRTGLMRFLFLASIKTLFFVYFDSSRSFLIPWFYLLSWSETLGKTERLAPPFPTLIMFFFSTVVLHSSFLCCKAECCNYLCSGPENRQFCAFQISFKLHFINNTLGLQVKNNFNNSKHQEFCELWAFHQDNV